MDNWLANIVGDVDSLHVEIDNLNDLLVGFCFIRSIDLRMGIGVPQMDRRRAVYMGNGCSQHLFEIRWGFAMYNMVLLILSPLGFSIILSVLIDSYITSWLVLALSYNISCKHVTETYFQLCSSHHWIAL
jgi:hypothetical protein